MLSRWQLACSPAEPQAVPADRGPDSEALRLIGPGDLLDFKFNLEPEPRLAAWSLRSDPSRPEYDLKFKLSQLPGFL